MPNDAPAKVLLVHGLFMRATMLRPMMAQLRRRGYQCLALTYPTRTQTLHDSVARHRRRPAPCHRPQPRRPLPPPSAPAMAAGTGARPRRHPRHAASGQQGGALFSRTPLAPPHPWPLLGAGAGWRGAAVGRLHPALEHRWHKGHRRGQCAAYFRRRRAERRHGCGQRNRTATSRRLLPLAHLAQRVAI